MKPTDVQALLQEMGFKAKIIAFEDNVTYLATASQGRENQIAFTCVREEHETLKAYHFFRFTTSIEDYNWDAERINVWNNCTLFAYVYRSTYDSRYLVAQMNVFLNSDECSVMLFRKHHEMFDMETEKLVRHINS